MARRMPHHSPDHRRRSAGRSGSSRAAFTLVELMVVLVIIGILMAFLVPMVLTAIRKARVTQIRAEITQLEQAVEAFRNKYGTYPPDGSNAVVMSRVIRKMFPRITPNELNGAMPILANLDPAEALPFWLRGFSKDPKRPFSGVGGPMNTATQRNEDGFYTFEKGRLTERLGDPATGQQDDVNGIPWSWDEELIHGRVASDNDIFPIYLVPRFQQPFVYFDSRTYIHRPENGPISPVPPPPHYPPVRFETTTSIQGLALPYRSDKTRRATPSDPILFEFVQAKTFQIISAGLDEDYGAWPAANITTVLTAWPTGFKRFPSRANYQSGDDTVISNFADGVLRDAEP